MKTNIKLALFSILALMIASQPAHGMQFVNKGLEKAKANWKPLAIGTVAVVGVFGLWKMYNKQNTTPKYPFIDIIKNGNPEKQLWSFDHIIKTQDKDVVQIYIDALKEHCDATHIKKILSYRGSIYYREIDSDTCVLWDQAENRPCQGMIEKLYNDYGINPIFSGYVLEDTFINDILNTEPTEEVNLCEQFYCLLHQLQTSVATTSTKLINNQIGSVEKLCNDDMMYWILMHRDKLRGRQMYSENEVIIHDDKNLFDYAKGTCCENVIGDLYNKYGFTIRPVGSPRTEKTTDFDTMRRLSL